MWRVSRLKPDDLSSELGFFAPCIRVRNFAEFHLQADPTEVGEEEAVEGIRRYIEWISNAKSYMTTLEREAKQQKKNIVFLSSTDDKFRLNIVRSLTLIKSTLAQLLTSLRVLGPWCAYQVCRHILCGKFWEDSFRSDFFSIDCLYGEKGFRNDAQK